MHSLVPSPLIDSLHVPREKGVAQSLLTGCVEGAGHETGIKNVA